MFVLCELLCVCVCVGVVWCRVARVLAFKLRFECAFGVLWVFYCDVEGVVE